MLSCRDLAQQHASDYIDGQLGWRGQLGIWFHILICVRCRRFIRQLRRVPSLLRAKTTVAPVDTVAEAETKLLGERLAKVYLEQQSTRE